MQCELQEAPLVAKACRHQCEPLCWLASTVLRRIPHIDRCETC